MRARYLRLAQLPLAPSLSRGALALAFVLVSAAPALAEEGVFTGALGGGAAVTLSDSPSAQGLVSLSGRYGISDRLNLEVPLDLALGAGPPEVLLGVGFGGVAWQTNHWRFSAGGGLAGDYSVAHHGPWSWGPYVQASLRWLAFWGVGFSLDSARLRSVGARRLLPGGCFGAFPLERGRAADAVGVPGAAEPGGPLATLDLGQSFGDRERPWLWPSSSRGCTTSPCRSGWAASSCAGATCGPWRGRVRTRTPSPASLPPTASGASPRCSGSPAA